MIYPRLEKLHLDQYELVVQPPELFEQAIDECERVIVRLFLHVQLNQSCLELLTEETSSLRDCPIDGGFRGRDLRFDRVRNAVKQVEELSDCSVCQYDVPNLTVTLFLPIFAVFAFASDDKTERTCEINCARSSARF